MDKLKLRNAGLALLLGIVGFAIRSGGEDGGLYELGGMVMLGGFAVALILTTQALLGWKPKSGSSD